MDEATNDCKKSLAQSPEVKAEQKQPACLKVSNYSPSNAADLSNIPKRKLSVFYRSFDVIAQIDQEKEKETLDFRRTSSSPSVRIEQTQEDTNSRNSEIDQQSLHKRGLVSTYRSLIESGKFLSSSSPDSLSEKCSSHNEKPLNNTNVSKSMPLSLPGIKLPQVREDTIVDNYATLTNTSIGKHYTLNNNGNYQSKKANENVAIDSRQSNSSPDLTNAIANNDNRLFIKKRIENAGSNDCTTTTTALHPGNSSHTILIFSRATTDLVKIKDSEYPRSFVNASNASRLGKYTSVDAEMSSHEDSSIGSDSEDESIEPTLHTATCTRDEVKTIGARSKSNSPSSQPSSSFSTGEPPRKPDSEELQAEKKENTEVGLKREKRQRFFTARRSLSESDCERYHGSKRRCRCAKEESFNEQEQFAAFPSFNDMRLQAIGLAASQDIDSVYRESIAENDLERKYIAFSIGLSTDRITLQRRIALSLRQRDQSEKNFMYEIQKMQDDIKELCPLCTDQESIDKVEKVRHQLDMITQSAYKVSYAAETLGAVYQEHRISKAIFIGDKYLQLLRSKCENLAAEIAETKQILLKNNIVIEEGSGDIGDDLPKIRYRNGLPCNNRTMMARRRASIATISRPLSSQDVIKEAPRQRNSVSGRVTLRRPSLCSEVQKWEHEKLNQTDSSNSVVELREIFEYTESRRNSIEENNNFLRTDQSNSVNRTDCDIANNVQDKDRLISKPNSFLELNVTKTVEKQLKSCIKTAEPLRIPRNIETWRPILWFIFVFFLGFFCCSIRKMMSSVMRFTRNNNKRPD